VVKVKVLQRTKSAFLSVTIQGLATVPIKLYIDDRRHSLLIQIATKKTSYL
jgi:hypothetical protein